MKLKTSTTPIIGGSNFSASNIEKVSIVWVSVSMQAKNTNSPFAISFVRSAPTRKNDTNRRINIQSTARELFTNSGVALILFAIFTVNLINLELIFRKISSKLDESNSDHFIVYPNFLFFLYNITASIGYRQK